MAKVCVEEFPMGSYPKQRSAGLYIDGAMEHGIDILAKNIQKDMQFVGLYTGDGTVRNGKSSCAQQHAYYYSWKIGKLTGKHIPFTSENIVFRSEKLIERAFQLPKHSCIILDEGDDLTAHYFSKLAMTLKKFFRKCGQLNLFIILILPDFFELPANYALTRSNFLVNVHFLDEFQRGYFKFYGPKAKKNLYLNGKKWKDYECVQSDYAGRFIHLYTVNEETYRKAKYDDMMLEEQEEVPIKTQLFEQKMKFFTGMHKRFPEILIKDLCEGFEISTSTATRYFQKNVERTPPTLNENHASRITYNNLPINKGDLSAQYSKEQIDRADRSINEPY